MINPEPRLTSNLTMINLDHQLNQHTHEETHHLYPMNYLFIPVTVFYHKIFSFDQKGRHGSKV
jgi:hypothetical protein